MGICISKVYVVRPKGDDVIDKSDTSDIPCISDHIEALKSRVSNYDCKNEEDFASFKNEIVTLLNKFSDDIIQNIQHDNDVSSEIQRLNSHIKILTTQKEKLEKDFGLMLTGSS